MPPLTALGRGWRRFRRLPALVQAGAAVVVLGTYTAILVALVGGGDENGAERAQLAREEAPPSPLERRVRRAVEHAKLFQREQGDVGEFRKPRVASVRCRAGRCSVEYTVAVPGRGRILFQQLGMVQGIFRDTDVERVVLRVVRVAPSGPAATQSGEEETPVGVPLLQTTCDRSKLEEPVDWRTQKEAQASLTDICVVRDFDQGAQHGGGG